MVPPQGSRGEHRSHVIAVQKDASVDFSNEEDIRHQVYSLSEQIQFDLLVEQGKSKTGRKSNIKTPADKVLLSLTLELLPDYNKTEDFDDVDDY